MTPTDEEPPPGGWCATMAVHRRLLDADPVYAQTRADIESFTFSRKGWARGRPREVVTIPVVVHVVWNAEAQNIDDAQVHRQLDVLNADFRSRNADLGGVPDVWRDRVGDGRIEFALATADPSGSPTSGITRTRTSVRAFGANDTVKSTRTGGAPGWPADRYLNVWVCQLGGGLLGYAQFPGGPPETDGVVLLHSATGTGGTARAPFDLGRTATHEVGHWLNLRHIWGDDGEGCSGSDFVADTPNQGGPNTGRPAWPQLSCNNAPEGDMFMNYMDYTDDAGMFMFTKGQVERMDACLAGPRSSFVTT
ncbi:zinc metalloprotease [Pilimelia anulata]|uniref:Zinc metalloprotease n=1 Tax=Pilimelia anulata TaxID=53371 RepID=A0A8J3F7S2_9ACTN|nr:zinc metalloprotease [Pilimelia anulata]GGJ79720.1 zinc metalloprotease [Pilimelia anulata]